jgi:hypothetical protein
MPETKKGNQLHQLLAVEQEKKSTSTTMIEECKKTFKDKQSHFDGETRKYIKKVPESGDLPDEHKEVVTKVAERLEYTLDFIGDAIDVAIQKEETNASGTAVAELAVDGQPLGTFSATSLLQLETQLKAIRNLYNSIPTLDPVKRWKFNEQNGLYETGVETSYRTEKRPRVIVLHPPTDKHPAQTQLINEDLQVGEWEKSYASGRITPLQKSNLLRNIDKLINAVKKARSIANNAEVSNVKISKKLFDFINKPLKDK